MSVTAAPKLLGALRVKSPVHDGAIVGGKYRLDSVIGSGGMAQVFSATDLAQGRRVAIKIVHADDDVEGQRQRVLREARAARSLHGEHVTRVFEVGALDGGRPYIVMELLEGLDLGALLERAGTLPVEDAATYLAQACAAIDEAHRAGIVHRDLKPSNLFLTRRPDGKPVVKLMDFGISKWITGDARLTATQDVLGTPHYMAPEQILCSQEVDARADVWALGAILYKLLTGRAPFEGRTPAAVIARIAVAPAPKLREVRPDAPAPLEVLVRRALEKAPARRLASARAFGAVLLPYVDDDMRERLRATLEDDPEAAARRARGADVARFTRPLAALALAGIGWAAWPRHPPAPRAAPLSASSLTPMATAGTSVPAGAGDPWAPAAAASAPSIEVVAREAGVRATPRIASAPIRSAGSRAHPATSGIPAVAAPAATTRAAAAPAAATTPPATTPPATTPPAAPSVMRPAEASTETVIASAPPGSAASGTSIRPEPSSSAFMLRDPYGDRR